MGYTLCILGCGTMGVAILSGVLASFEAESDPHPVSKWEYHDSGTVTPISPPEESIPSKYIACVSREENAVNLVQLFRGQGRDVEVVAGANVSAVNRADVVLLCCKPQASFSIMNEKGMNAALDGKLLISIVAGVTIAQIKSWLLPSTRVLRAMPNTPCKIREGMTVVSTTPSPNAEFDRSIVSFIFSSIGRCRFLDEKHFDACTALSGAGPAFACIFLEAMADGGVMMGLPRTEALELAAQTLQGAARMVLQSHVHPSEIKDAVATPGGCTIAGLLALEDGKVRSTIARAIEVATKRASELGKISK